jgi:very-short-patch-repair endonuclease
MRSSVNRARYLGKTPTRYEKILWRRLRNRRFSSDKFRRQHAIDRYVLDFYCPKAQLAIELDGGVHNYLARETHDRARTNFLAERGIFVLRFWNHQLRENFDSVLEAIWFELERRANPSPQSSPFEKGRGRSR